MRWRDGDARLLATVLVICLASPASLAQDTEAESGSATAQNLLAWRNRQKLSDVVGAACCQIEVHAPSSEGYYNYKHVNALQVPPELFVSSSLVCTARDELPVSRWAEPTIARGGFHAGECQCVLHKSRA